MIYLDNGATSFPKPEAVGRAMAWAVDHCGNPGRGAYALSMAGAEALYHCRKTAGELFACYPEQVVFTGSCTHGLNMAIKTLVRPGQRVVISGFEHNAVVRPLHALGARVEVAGRRLFSWEDTLEDFHRLLKTRPSAAVFTHQSNVFGYILPIKELGELCRQYGVPFIVDAAQSAGSQSLNLQTLGADFIAMPGHKGLLGPMGTGLLLCGSVPEPLMQGGTGSQSQSREMPGELPDRGEAGTANVPGICGLCRGLQYIKEHGANRLGEREAALAAYCARELENMGLRVFRGEHQGGVFSFLPPGEDCERAAEAMGEKGICLRAGLHCAPLAHESAGTLETGTLRVSCGPFTTKADIRQFLRQARLLFSGKQDFFFKSSCYPERNPL